MADPTPEALPPTVKALEAKIAALEERLKTSDDANGKIKATLDTMAEKLEAELVKAKAEAPAPKRRLFDHLDGLGKLF